MSRCGTRSPSEIEAHGVVANVRLAEELVRAEVRAAVLVDFRVESFVAGPGVQVATGEGERGAGEAVARHVPLRHAERNRNLAQLGEARVLDVTSVRTHQAGDVGRLIVEGLVLAIGLWTYGEGDAPEVPVEIEQLLTAATIEQRANGDRLIKRERRGDRQLAGRKWRSEIDGGVAERDFARRPIGDLRVGRAVVRGTVDAADVAVAVLVGEAENGDLPVATERIPVLVTLMAVVESDRI